jgi:hypothetical protein
LPQAARLGLLALAAVALLCARAGADEPVPSTEAGPPTIAAVLVSQPPTVDGALDDPCWQAASRVEGFWRTAHDAPEFEKTEAWLCYDARAIYVAFRCHDSEPTGIRCTQKKRQGSMGDDDFVSLWLDVSNTGGTFYMFRVNPAGTQMDRVPGGTSEKIEWKGDWRAAAKTNDCGWTAEIEIPFSILRYPQGQSQFRFDLERQLARKQDTSLWPAGFARKFDADDCARWTGISTPPVPFKCVVMPYALSVFSDEDEDREPLTAGLDVKGAFPNGVVGLATVNPDFRNLEDVVETIDFTFVERYLPEYRPFFQEGNWYFPPSSIFYSRRVEDFDIGLKSFGAIGQDAFGILDTYSRGGESHLAWDFEHRFGTTGLVAVFGVAPRIPDEPRNLSGGVYADRGWPFDGGSRYASGSWMASRTDGEGGDDTRVEFHAGTNLRQGIGYHLEYMAIGPEFTATDGYVPETDIRKLGVSLDENRSYDQGALQSIWRGVWGNTGESGAGSRRTIGAGQDFHWRNGTSLWLGGSGGVRDGLDTSGYWIGGCWTRNDRYRRGDWGFSWGETLGYSSNYVSLSQAFQLSRRWYGEVRLERVDSAELDNDGNIVPPETKRQLVLTHTYDLSDERTLSGRLVKLSEGTNFYLAYRQRVRKGTDLLIVVGDPNADEWASRLALKAIWCL